MKNENGNWPTTIYVSAFLIGVILFWSIGKNWLNLESILVFLAGVAGVALVVLVIGLWNIFQNSRK
jgi:hypothetical protein